MGEIEILEQEDGPDETKTERVIEIRIDNLEKKVGKVAYPFITGSTFIYLAVLSAAIFIGGLVSEKVIFYPIAMLAFFLSALVVIAGFLTVEEKEKPVVQRFGEYWKILKPGFNIIIPMVDKIAYDFDSRTTKIPLFTEVKRVEFKDSTEEGVTFGIYVAISDAYRAAYFTADDVYAFVNDIAENIVKRVFGETIIDDAIENKMKVREDTNHYLDQPMEELVGLVDDDFLRLLDISKDEAKKLSPNKILRIAGAIITDTYFTDIDLGKVTKDKRAELLKIRLDEKIAQGKEKVEKAKVGVEEQVARQEEKKGSGTRKRLDAIKGGGNLTDQEVLDYEIKRVKYDKGVDDVSEINIQGGDGSSGAAATAGTIIGKTFAEASEDKKRTPKPKETEESEESEE